MGGGTRCWLHVTGLPTLLASLRGPLWLSRLDLAREGNRAGKLSDAAINTKSPILVAPACSPAAAQPRAATAAPIASRQAVSTSPWWCSCYGAPTGGSPKLPGLGSSLPCQALPAGLWRHPGGRQQGWEPHRRQPASSPPHAQIWEATCPPYPYMAAGSLPPNQPPRQAICGSVLHPQPQMPTLLHSIPHYGCLNLPPWHHLCCPPPHT